MKRNFALIVIFILAGLSLQAASALDSAKVTIVEKPKRSTVTYIKDNYTGFQWGFESRVEASFFFGAYFGADIKAGYRLNKRHYVGGTVGCAKTEIYGGDTYVACPIALDYMCHFFIDRMRNKHSFYIGLDAGISFGHNEGVHFGRSKVVISPPDKEYRDPETGETTYYYLPHYYNYTAVLPFIWFKFGFDFQLAEASWGKPHIFIGGKVTALGLGMNLGFTF